MQVALQFLLGCNQDANTWAIRRFIADGQSWQQAL